MFPGGSERNEEFYGQWVRFDPALNLAAQTPRALLPIEFANSAEFGWLAKEVHQRRVLADMTDPARWTFTGTGRLSFPTERRISGMRVLRGALETMPGNDLGLYWCTQPTPKNFILRLQWLR